MRIEDTDKERSKKEYENAILDALEWLGLDFDEGPIKDGQADKGNMGPYRQSERTEVYRAYLKKMLDAGFAFWCYHTQEELEREKADQEARKEALRHVCDDQSKIRDKKRRGIVRFKNPGGKIAFHDLVKGDIEFDAALLGDFSVAKDFGEPLYNFAVVIDDYEMKISHVIRGDDHISNTPKQILMQKSLGFSIPFYAHIPMILGPDKSKLSKRHGATSLLEYKKAGYLPDAMFNFLSFLGWNPGGEKEILTRGEIVEQFSLERVQKSGAVFNIEKLDWLNHEYILQLGVDELTKLCEPYVPGSFQFDYLRKVVSLEQGRLKKLSDIAELGDFFFNDKLEYDAELLRWKTMTNEELGATLEKLEKVVSDIEVKDFIKEKLERIIMPKAEEWGIDGGKVDRGRTLWPLRTALSGKKASPGPFEIMEVLGKEKCVARLRGAKNVL